MGRVMVGLALAACSCSGPPEGAASDAAPADAAEVDGAVAPVGSVSLDPNGVTPLAAELTVATASPSTLEVQVASGEESFVLTFDEPRTEHAVPILGLRADRTYALRVTAIDEASGARQRLAEPLTVTTAPLPDAFPEIVIETLDPDLVEPGLTMLTTGRTADYVLILDRAGEPVWYYVPPDDGVGDLRQLPNGNLLYLSGGAIIEMDMLGNRLLRYPSAAEDYDYHHEVFPTADGTYLTLGLTVAEVADFPQSTQDPDDVATADVTSDTIIEVDTDGTVLRRHALLDILDPTRIGYDALSTHFKSGTPNDWSHANAIIHDPSDDTVIVSARHQDAVFKADRATGELVWILANHDNWGAAWLPYLLDPTGAGAFAWPYHQHAPEFTPAGTLLLFDNGNHRASPFDGTTPVADADNYSRAVEYRIDEYQMTVEQVWEYGSAADPRLYAFFICDADHLPETGNVLATFGGLRGIGDQSSAEMGRGTFQIQLVEVARAVGDGDQVVWRAALYSDADEFGAGWASYRSERIRSLYPRD